MFKKLPIMLNIMPMIPAIMLQLIHKFIILKTRLA